MTQRSPSTPRFARLVTFAALLCACAGEDGEGRTSEVVTGGTAAVVTGGTGGIASGGGGTPTGGSAVNPIGATGGVATGGTPNPGTGGATGGGGVATGGSLGSGGGSPGTGGLGGLAGSGGVPTGGSTPFGTGGDSAGGSGGDATGGQPATGGSEPTGGGGLSGGSGGEGGAAPGGQPGIGGSEPGGQPGTGGDGTSGAGGTSPLPATTDYSAPGPFETTTDSNVGPDGECTIFRPVTLGEDGFLHAPIVFGPGIGMQATQLRDLLLSFASHGFVVIGTGVLEGGPNDPNNRSAMENALDWILDQNDQPGIYQGKLYVTHAVSMGYSVGGTAAVEIGGHPAVATTVSIHGHIASAALHGPMLQTSGTEDNVGLPMQQQTYDASQVQTFLGTVQGAGHGYIQEATGGVQRPAIIAWMRYWIYNDTGARDYFWGDDCVLCTAPWTNPQRKNWE